MCLQLFVIVAKSLMTDVKSSLLALWCPVLVKADQIKKNIWFAVLLHL